MKIGTRDIKTFIGKKDRGLGTRLETIWFRAAERGWHNDQKSEGGMIGGTYHAKTVEDNIKKIIPDNWKGEKVSTVELFLLSVAACLHDVGKHYDAVGDHAVISAEEVQGKCKLLGLESSEADAVARIIQVHNTKDDPGESVLPSRPWVVKGGVTVDLHKLAAILKLADMLHTDWTRVSEHVDENSLTEDQQRDKYLFRKYTHGWFPKDDKIIEVQISPEGRTNVVGAAEKGIEMMNSELSHFWKGILKQYGYPYQFDLFIKPTVKRAPRESVFMGMEYFREGDTELFKGREEDVKKLEELITIHPSTLLIGDSGVGKSSLIHAGLGLSLEKLGFKFLATNISEFLKKDILRTLLVGKPSKKETIQDLLKAISKEYFCNVVIAIDEFENIKNEEEMDFFERSISDIKKGNLSNIKLLLTYRSEAEGRLGPLWQKIANSAQGLPKYYLQNLNLEGAKAALKVAFETKVIRISDLLLNIIVKDIAKECGSENLCYPPYVQIVLQRLVEYCEDSKPPLKEINETVYNNLGHAKGIIGNYLFNSLEKLGEFKEDGKKVLSALIHPSGMRTHPLSLEDLTYQCNLPENKLNVILNKLKALRIIREINGNYEITHEYVAFLIKEKLLSNEQREAKLFQEVLNNKAEVYSHTHDLFATSEMKLFYRHRKVLKITKKAQELLFKSCIAGLGPAWYFLKDLDKNSIINFCVNALKDPHWRVRKSSVLVLGNLGAHQHIGQVRESINAVTAVRTAAIESLAKLSPPGTPSHKEDLSLILKNLNTLMGEYTESVVNAEEWVATFSAIERIGSSQELKTILLMLDIKELPDEAVEAAQKAFVALADSKNLSWIEEALSEYLVEVMRRLGIEDLKFETIAQLEPIHLYAIAKIKLIEGQDVSDFLGSPTGKEIILKVIRRFGLKEYLPLVKNFLHDPLSRVHSEAWITFADIADIDDLSLLLKSISPNFFLVKSLECLEVYDAILKAIVRLASEEEIPIMVNWCKDYIFPPVAQEFRTARAGIAALVRLASRDYFDFIREKLRHEDWHIRRTATMGIARLATQTEVDEILDEVLNEGLPLDVLFYLDWHLYCPVKEAIEEPIIWLPGVVEEAEELIKRRRGLKFL